MVMIWLLIALLFLLFEMGHPGLFLFLSFSLGGSVAAAVAYGDWSLVVQCSVFLGASFVAFLVLRSWVKKIERHAPPRTNVYALQGRRGFVVRPIKEHVAGAVKVGGEMWSARCMHGSFIDQGQEVEVVQVQGVYLIVKHIQ